MTTFIILGALLVTAALALVTWPLYRAGPSDGRGTWIAVLVLVIALPAGSLLLYRSASNFSWDPAAAGAAAPHSLQEMIGKLEERLKQNPADVDGWLMLGRSQFVTNNYPRAVTAFAEAYRLTDGKNLEALIGYGESLTLQDQGALRGRAGELFEAALALDPQNQKGLWYGGLGAAMGGKMELARERWLRLLGQELPPDVHSVLVQRITEVDAQLGRKNDPELAKLAQATPPAGLPAAVGESQAGAAVAPAAPASAAVVHVRIRLGPAFGGKLPPGAPLFVLARDPTQPGPPFAVKRFAIAALPMDVELTEQDAMLPSRTISTARKLVIVARFSASGQPVAASGDLYGEVPYELAGAKPVELLVDKQVP